MYRTHRKPGQGRIIITTMKTVPVYTSVFFSTKRNQQTPKPKNKNTTENFFPWMKYKKPNNKDRKAKVKCTGNQIMCSPLSELLKMKVGNLSLLLFLFGFLWYIYIYIWHLFLVLGFPFVVVSALFVCLFLFFSFFGFVPKKALWACELKL